MKAVTIGRAGLWPISLILTGCSWLVSSLQGNISGHQDSLELITVKAAQVLHCVETPGGVCPAAAGRTPKRVPELAQAWSAERVIAHPAALRAAQALSSPSATSLDSLMNQAAGLSTPPKEGTSLSRMETRNFAKNLYDATNTGGWAQLASDLAGERKTRVHISAKDLSDQDLDDAIKAVNLVGAYMTAYFNSGQVVSLTIDPSHLESSAESELKNQLGLSADTAKSAVTTVIDQLSGQTLGSDGKYHLLTAKGDGGFVTRGGDKYTFPTISVTVTPGATHPLSASKIDFVEIGSDIVRVYIEAIGDMWGQLPAVQQATGVQAKLLPVFTASATFSQTEFANVDSWASQAETAAGAATGQLIRGIGWVSLNNEALAKIIETAVGVAVRKGTEKVAYCIEACGDKTLRETVRAGGGDLVSMKVVVVE